MNVWFVSLSLAREPVALPVVSGPPTDAVRLVFLGDSGKLPDGDSCSWRPDGSAASPCVITTDERIALIDAIRAEHPTAVYGLGDLVYWRAPACRTPRARAYEKLEATVGSLYGGLGAPAYLVLGNHDKAQRARAPRRVRCLSAYAEQVDGVELPAAQYVVDHGLARVLVVDTNRESTLPTEALRVVLAEDRGWTIVAAHHDLRVAFDKDDPYSRTVDLQVGRWLLEVGAVPDLWANGHAHLLQLGVVDVRTVDDGEVGEDPELGLLPALTSGAGSKLRAAPTCAGLPGVSADDRDRCAAEDPRGMPDFSMSRFGYAVVDLTAGRMEVRFADHLGRTLYRWARTPDDARGASLPP